MKMQKMMMLTVAAALFLMPQLNAQEDDGEAGAGAEAGEEKAAESADKPEGGAGAEAGGEKAKEGEEPQKKTVFSDHQQRIKELREKKAKLEEAGKRREAGKVLDELKQEQKKLKALFNKESAKVKTEIAHLKEQSKKTSPAMRKKLQEDLKKQEEALKTLETDAAIETWCTEPKEKDASQDKSKSAAKNKSKKKSKISRKKKKK